MKKRKCYVLMIAKVFPKGHINEGQPTHFYTKIVEGIKKHTIRLNYDLWKKRIDEINKGNAYLSVRCWSGKPYRSKQVELLDFYELRIDKIKANVLGWFINDCDADLTTEQLAKNDGLSLDDFLDWFRDHPKEPMALIHFLDFKY